LITSTEQPASLMKSFFKLPTIADIFVKLIAAIAVNQVRFSSGTTDENTL
jgi:hypothetical protein